jgi:EpsI family protein
MILAKLGNTALVGLLLATGALAWALQLQPALTVDASALATLPDRIDSYQGQEVPLESTVESVLRADFNLQRVYWRGDRMVWLYVGYYGTSRGGRPEHTPRGCYTGAGWAIESARTLDATGQSELRVNEFLIDREGEQRLVHFWYRSHRRTGMLGGWSQNIDRFVGRISGNRADGALIRISTPLEGEDVILARGRLMAFASHLDPLIAARWPKESKPS